MKIDFAPPDVPLPRRLQTVAVLQWVFSFLGLGEWRDLPHAPRIHTGLLQRVLPLLQVAKANANANFPLRLS